MHKQFLTRILDADTGTDAPASGSNASSAAGTDSTASEQNQGQEQSQSNTSESAQNGVSKLLNTLGVSSTDDLKAIVEAKNKADKASRSQLENVQNDLDKANTSLTSLTKQNAALQAQVAASKAGIVGAHIDDAAILAQAYVADGKAKDIAAATKLVVKNNPSFAQVTQQTTGADGTAVFNGNVSGAKQPAITKQQFAKMGYAERAKLFAEHPDTYNKLKGQE